MHSVTRFGVALLAAGAGTRMGGPKAIYPLDGLTLLERILATLQAFEAASEQNPCAIVVGSAYETVHALCEQQATQNSGLMLLRNTAVARERNHSLRLAVEALPADLPCLIWPVDVPLVSLRALRRLLREPLAAATFRIPTYHQRGGHPVLLAPALRSRVLALRDEDSLRDLHRAGDVDCERVEVGDESVLFDLDTPDDAERARAWLSAREESS